MGENERKGPGEAAGDGRARHGYQNEVSWNGGKGGQPYTNQEEEHAPPGVHGEIEGGNRGAASGRNMEQSEALKGFPGTPPREAPRESATGDSEGKR